MTGDEVLEIVKKATGVAVGGLKGKGIGFQTHARYCAILIMHEEGFTCNEIAVILEVHKTVPLRALERIYLMLSGKINTGASREFKWLYLKCIAKITEKEDAA